MRGDEASKSDLLYDFVLFEDFDYIKNMEDQFHTYNKPELDFYNIKK